MHSAGRDPLDHFGLSQVLKNPYWYLQKDKERSIFVHR